MQNKEKMMDLVIIEGVGKQETIKKYLGQNFQVVATKGHVRDLPESSLGVDITDNFKPQYVTMPDKKEIVKMLKDKASKADKIYLATDPDREGEAISWHLCHVLGLKEEDPVRISFNEISKHAVLEGLEHPRGIDRKLVDAQQARRVLDRLVGYKLSPILCRKIQPKLSGGRVQSATLKLVIDREKEIQNFKPEEYWTLQAEMMKQDKKSTFSSALQKINGKKADIKNKEQMDSVLATLSENDYVIKDIKKSVTKSHPGAPYTTSTMQQDAGTKLGMNLKKTSETAQQLYEGVSLGAEGKTALVTYIRTDSVRISPEAITMARNYISQKYGEKYLPKTANFYKTKAAAQDAHEAIRPISLDRTPESIKEYVSSECYKLYKMIYEKFVACQMADATFNSVAVEIENGKNLFKATGRTPVFDGFMIAYNFDKKAKKTDENEEKSGEENDLIPELEIGEVIICNKLNPQQKFTKAPARFNEGTIVKEMEENGIGRPATTAQTVNILFTRKYIEKEGKSIKPTELGFKVCDLLDKYFGDIVNVQFTAEMEDKLDEIAATGLPWQDVISKFYAYFSKRLSVADGDSTKFKIEPKQTDQVCEKCGHPMLLRTGRYGEFLACSNYPNCKNIKSIVKEAGVCPKCGKPVVEKHSKKSGKVFYGCSGYPECDFISWEAVAAEKCPECGAYMTTKNMYGNTRVKCSSCNYTKTIKAKQEKTEE